MKNILSACLKSKQNTAHVTQECNSVNNCVSAVASE